MLLPLMQTRKWKDFATAINDLAKNIDKYIEYLQQQAQKLKEAHCSPTPLRSCDDGTSTHAKIIMGTHRKPHLIARYKSLEERMLPLAVYEEPVFLNDFAPPNPRHKYTYLQELSLLFKIQMYSYNYGNNRGSLYYDWKIPANPADYDPSKSHCLISLVKQNIKHYHSREIKRQFISRFSLVSDAKASVMTDLYQFLTTDSSTTSINEEVQTRSKFFLIHKIQKLCTICMTLIQGGLRYLIHFGMQWNHLLMKKCLLLWTAVGME